MEMKIYKLLSVILGSAMSFAFSSCENASNSFPDYEGGVSVYFAYQYPVRTIVLGNDPVVDNSADRQHKCAIYATMGGAYGGRNITIDIAWIIHFVITSFLKRFTGITYAFHILYVGW